MKIASHGKSSVSFPLLLFIIIFILPRINAFLLNRHEIPRGISRPSTLSLLRTRRRFRLAGRSTTTAIRATTSGSSKTGLFMSTSSSSSPPSSSSLRFVDIGANLLEERFTAGIYRGTFRHEPDLVHIWQRAYDVGCRRIILTAGTRHESQQAVQRAREWNAHADNPGIRFYSTVGIHPTRCQQEFIDQQKDGLPLSAKDVLNELCEIAIDGQSDGTVVAIGEIGLDYDRLEFCAKDVQQEFLVKQLQTLAQQTGLPLFLHNRSVGKDLYDILKQHRDCWKAGGVVHSFDDTADLATALMEDLNLYIGLNGCSLRTTESLDVVQNALPLDRILLETDCPYCEVRATHPGHKFIQTTWPAKAEKKFEAGSTVKNRQEPCHIIQIAEIVAATKGVPIEELAEAVFQNSCRLYGWSTNSDA